MCHVRSPHALSYISNARKLKLLVYMCPGQYLLETKYESFSSIYVFWVKENVGVMSVAPLSCPQPPYTLAFNTKIIFLNGIIKKIPFDTLRTRYQSAHSNKNQLNSRHKIFGPKCNLMCTADCARADWFEIYFKPVVNLCPKGVILTYKPHKIYFIECM